MNSGAVPVVLFYLQHMLGVGHIFRARRLIEGLSARGFQVEVVFGGVPVGEMGFAAKGVTLLPPVKAGAIDYSYYTDGDGNPLTSAYLDNRQDRLLTAFDRIRPDVIIIEQFPFGRRILRPELLALLEQSRNQPVRPLTVCSVRDILQEKRKPGRSEEAIGTIEAYFDAVLVHSDPSVIALDATLPMANRIADKLKYTGFVVPADRGGEPDEVFDVVATVGGGAFGEGLLRSALAARRISSISDARWCLVTGPNLPQNVVQELHAQAPEGVALREFLPNLWRFLATSRLSISQAGYNTVADILRAGCRSVLVPSDIVGQTEQLRRAELLAASGLAICLPESQTTARTLAEAIDLALALPKAKRSIDMTGVETSAEIIDRMIRSHRG